MFKQLQQIGKAFMLPIAILPAAGLLLGIGGALSNKATVQVYPVLDNPVLQGIFQIMSAAGSVVFANLALLLCIGLGIGLAKRDKGVAALAAVVGYLIMTGTINALISIFSPEVKGIDTGVIGSFVMGLLTVKLHNRYHNIQLPQILGFFGGSRFVPIVTAFAAIFVGFLFFLIWPTFQGWLVSAGEGIASMGAIGTFFYGFLMRLSGAVGLHHMIYPLFWYTELGGTEIVNGETIIGAQKIFFAQLADPNHQGLFTEGTRFFAGRFDTMMFGLPAACLAMYHCVPKARRGLIGGLFLGAALTSFITGITEPIEFMFLFVAPWLYVFHAFLDGVSFFIADFLNISIGNTFSGGFIDFLLFGILQGNENTNWILVVVVGVFWAMLYYFSFRFLITKFDVMTPGRAEEQEEVVESTNSSLTENAHHIIEALGKAENIEHVDACITRLRVNVKDVKTVDKARLKALGAIDVLEVGGGIQAIFGAKAVLYKSEVNQILGKED
ncbi:PTS transporter subunit EIIC [Pasteurella multocida]|uniref:PTS transporter subunit EIIC n=2 Tax=Pasteurella multocida TaxID=747 RepID=UPI0002569E01|nr:PTS transporter subunit EIIC [Pasteurella multocida]AFF24827.1 PTS system, IIBC components [Pasteurella multocida subsp. multocida str. HN06]MCL8064451.1 PTS transporter subunit EIIC [Pasteurella multocida]MCW4599691.1 PTS transporter subunit EIIC [Pasteurella multocida subsp. multocida]MDY0626124.1 PTS transporter subunit EIIC [Pasteurella multocida]MDY0668780.1 PTS transporter subunit EIIC [Pasteurella multocida]